MNQLITYAPTKSGATEPVADAIREHEVTTSDWAFHQIAARMNSLFDQLNIVFFNSRLPKAVISIGPDLIVRYGYYRIGRDDIGAKNRIHLNSRHFGRSESDVAVTLLHEMLHVHQHLFETPCRKPSYHNAEFVKLAASLGLESEIESGRTKHVSSELRRTLAGMGFSHDKCLISGVDDRPIQRPLRKVLWQCKCGQEVWVDRDILANVVCSACQGKFERAA